ncbi:MAG: glycosyltransferase [Pseudomonadota bacterium]
MPSSIDDKITKPLRIVMPVQALESTGGMQRFEAELANYLAKQGHCLYCFAPCAPGSTPRFKYDERVHIVHYKKNGSKQGLATLRQQILQCEADVVLVPCTSNLAVFWCAALIGTDVALLYSEHGNPWAMMNGRWNKSEREATLWLADGIHVLMPNFVQSIPEALRGKVRSIFNPLTLPLRGTCNVASPLSREYFTLLSLGRLESKAKQLNVLIAAFALLAYDFPKWKLDIWGTGSDEKALQQQIEQLPQELQQRVRLCGLAKTPTEQYSTADIFCIPSRFEGFGLTVTEAMSQCVPVVGFAGCSGVNGLVHHEENGLLAPEMTPESLAGELRRLMEDNQLRQRLGQQAQEDAKSFAPECIYPQWEELIYQTAACKGHTRRSLLDSDDISQEERVYQETFHRLLKRRNIRKEPRIYRNLRRWLRKHPQYTNKVNALLRLFGFDTVRM